MAPAEPNSKDLPLHHGQPVSMPLLLWPAERKEGNHVLEGREQPRIYGSKEETTKLESKQNLKIQKDPTNAKQAPLAPHAGPVRPGVSSPQLGAGAVQFSKDSKKSKEQLQAFTKPNLLPAPPKLINFVTASGIKNPPRTEDMGKLLGTIKHQVHPPVVGMGESNEPVSDATPSLASSTVRLLKSRVFGESVDSFHAAPGFPRVGSWDYGKAQELDGNGWSASAFPTDHLLQKTAVKEPMKEVDRGTFEAAGTPSGSIVGLLAFYMVIVLYFLLMGRVQGRFTCLSAERTERIPPAQREVEANSRGGGAGKVEESKRAKKN